VLVRLQVLPSPPTDNTAALLSAGRHFNFPASLASAEIKLQYQAGL
jgi:hypothetical protein